MLILIAGDIASEARMLARAIAHETADVVIVPSLDHLRALRGDEGEKLFVSCERLPVPVLCEPEYKVSRYDDDRRGDPARDTAMLRREMLARERSNRHMLKRAKGRS